MSVSASRKKRRLSFSNKINRGNTWGANNFGVNDFIIIFTMRFTLLPWADIIK